MHTEFSAWLLPKQQLLHSSATLQMLAFMVQWWYLLIFYLFFWISHIYLPWFILIFELLLVIKAYALLYHCQNIYGCLRIHSFPVCWIWFFWFITCWLIVQYPSTLYLYIFTQHISLGCLKPYCDIGFWISLISSSVKIIILISSIFFLVEYPCPSKVYYYYCILSLASSW